MNSETHFISLPRRVARTRLLILITDVLQHFFCFLPVLLVALRVNCAVPETASGQTLEIPLQEEIRLAAETGKIAEIAKLLEKSAPAPEFF
jgi:hypothetical protein